jgi:hypothetical protein
MSFLKKLQEKLGQHNPEDVDQLVLDDLFENVRSLSDVMKVGLEKYKELKHLSLNNFGLACLKNLPNLPNLEILELRENLLLGDDFNLITAQYPNLKKLKLGGNPIKKFEVFDVFSKSDLLSIELFNTPLSLKKGYKDILYHKIRSLESIDNVDRDGYHLESDFYNDEDSDAWEDDDYEEEGNGEDEFDPDFDDEEEDFELSDYGSTVEKEKKDEEINDIETKNDESKPQNCQKKVKISWKKGKEEKNNYHSDDNEVSVTSSINPNKVNKNKKDLVSGLKGKSEGKVTSSNKNDVVEQDDDMVMIKKIEKTKEDK